MSTCNAAYIQDSPKISSLSPAKRRVAYAVSFEAIGVVASTIFLFMIGKEASHALGFAVVSTIVALIWNMAYNFAFEKFEKKIHVTHRPMWMRGLHILGFQIGMTAAMVPVAMTIFSVGVFDALIIQSSMIIFFVIYGALFTYVFDKVIGLPQR